MDVICRPAVPWVLKADHHRSCNSPVNQALSTSPNRPQTWAQGRAAVPPGLPCKHNLLESLRRFTLCVSLSGDEVHRRG